MKRWRNPLSRLWAALTAALVLGLSAGIAANGAKADQPANKAVAPPFQGTVSGPDGRRVAGATVLAVADVGNGDRLTTTTDVEGRFAFAALPAGKTAFPSVYLYVVKDGFGPLIHMAIDPVKLSPVELKLPAPGAFQGTVTNSAGGLIAGAEVQVGYVHRSKSLTGSGASWGFQPPAAIRGTRAEPYFIAVTDQAGGFRFPALPAESELIFRVSAKGYADLDTGAGGPKEGQFVVKTDAAPAELVLKQEAVIRGRVTSNVSGISPDVAVVQLNGTRSLHGFHRRVKPGTDGGYEANGLPAGPISVSLDLPSDAAATSVGAAENTKAGQANDLDLTIISGVEVTGQVLVRDTNEPVPGVLMATSGLVSPTGFHFGGKPTDAKGRFTLRLPPGTITVMVWRAPGEYREIDARRQTIVVPADATRFEMPEPFVLGKLGAAPATPGGAAPKETAGPKPISTEQSAASLIRQLGGWYTLDSDGHVVEINMVYHEERGERTKNRLIDSDGALRAARQFPKLKKLYLAVGQATDDGLAALVGLTELEELMIWSAAKVSDAGVAHLAGLPKLQNIHISEGAIGDGALAIFAKLPSIETLSLQGNNFSDAGLKHLSGMKQLRSLWIGMNRQFITDAGVQHLAGLTGLEQLDVSKSRLTATGIRALKDLTQLKRLYIRGANAGAGIDDAAVGPLLGMNRLQHLGIDDTTLTPAGVRMLMDLASLEDLSLTSPLIEAATVDDLKKQRPGLQLRITKPGD